MSVKVGGGGGVREVHVYLYIWFDCIISHFTYILAIYYSIFFLANFNLKSEFQNGIKKLLTIHEVHISKPCIKSESFKTTF